MSINKMKSKFFQLDKAIDIVTEYSLEESINLIKQLDRLYSHQVTVSLIKKDTVYRIEIRHAPKKNIPIVFKGELEYLDDEQTRLTGAARVSHEDVLFLYIAAFVMTLMILFVQQDYNIMWLVLPLFSIVYVVHAGYAQENVYDLIRQIGDILLTE